MWCMKNSNITMLLKKYYLCKYYLCKYNTTFLRCQEKTPPEKSFPWEVRGRVRVRVGPGFFFRGDFFLEPFLQIMLSFFRNVMLLLANIMLTFCKYNTTFKNIVLVSRSLPRLSQSLFFHS